MAHHDDIAPIDADHQEVANFYGDRLAALQGDFFRLAGGTMIALTNATMDTRVEDANNFNRNIGDLQNLGLRYLYCYEQQQLALLAQAMRENDDQN